MSTTGAGTWLRVRWCQGDTRTDQFRWQTATVPVAPDVGDEPRILSGPFAGRSCIVLSVGDKVATVIVDVFDWATPVQIGLHELGRDVWSEG